MLLRGGVIMRKIMLSLLALLMVFLIFPLAVNASGHIDGSNDITPIERINSLKEYSKYQAYQDNEVIVRFKPVAAKSFSIMNAAHMDVGASVKRAFRLVEGLQIVQLDKGVSIDRAIQRYRQNQNVLYAEPNYQVFALDSRCETLTNDNPDANGDLNLNVESPEPEDESKSAANGGDYSSEEDIIDDNAKGNTDIDTETDDVDAKTDIDKNMGIPVTSDIRAELIEYERLISKIRKDTVPKDKDVKTDLDNEITKLDIDKSIDLFSDFSIDALNNERFTKDVVVNYIEVEPNNSIQQANLVDGNYAGYPSYNIFGTITDYYFDMDYFRFDITQPGTIDILGIWIGDYFERGWEDDLGIGLLNSEGDIIAAAGLYGKHPYNYRSLVFDITEAGTYYILVLQLSDYKYLYTGELYGLNVIFEPVVYPKFENLWGLKNTGQIILGQSGYVGADISAINAWQIEKGSGDTIIAVVDSGVDYTHPNLINNMWVSKNGYHGKNFINGSNYPMDDDGHGTHVAGTIAAIDNTENGIKGVMWDASIMALKVLDSTGVGNVADIIESIEYARDNGAKVINMSLGSNENSLALKDALASSQAIVVASAGNENSNNDIVPVYPANYNLPNILSVSATDNRDSLADFSNYGFNKVHVAAPGVSILSSKPGGGFGYASGTSMAAPHVSGLAGLLLSKNPDMGNIEVIQLIKNNTDPIQNLSSMLSSGGRINALKTLNAAKESEYEISAVVIQKDNQLVMMDLDFFTSARVASVFVFDYDGKLILPSYIKSSDGNFYSLGMFTSSRVASDGTVKGGLRLLNNNPQYIEYINPSTVIFQDGQFIIVG